MSKVISALGTCHPDCPFCAREFWRWVKSRMHQMDRGQDGAPSFSQAAATSIRARG